MPSVQMLQKIQRTVVIPFEDEELTVTYRLSAINNKLDAYVNTPKASIYGWIERVVASWDLTDEGKPVPLSEEELTRLDIAIPVLRLVQDTVLRDTWASNLRQDRVKSDAGGK